MRHVRICVLDVVAFPDAAARVSLLRIVVEEGGSDYPWTTHVCNQMM
jgi:hypothetical protein